MKWMTTKHVCIRGEFKGRKPADKIEHTGNDNQHRAGSPVSRTIQTVQIHTTDE